MSNETENIFIDADESIEYRMFSDFLLFANAGFQPGEANLFCASVKDEKRREIIDAEYLYFQGETEKAYRFFSNRLKKTNDPYRFNDMLFFSLSAIASGRLSEMFKLYTKAKEKSQSTAEKKESELIRCFLIAFHIITSHSKEIEFIEDAIGIMPIPASIKPAAYYASARYLLESGDVGRAIGLAEGALGFMEAPHPVSQIYLNLIIARGYIIRQNWNRAEHYFRMAWRLAKPDGLYMPFAEHRAMLSGLVEKCLRYENPEEYKKIQNLSVRYHRNWTYVHNMVTGESVSAELTVIEYNVASLAAFGMRNAEIADFLRISVNSVRSHLRNIFNKLNIKNRKELIGYVIR